MCLATSNEQMIRDALSEAWQEIPTKEDGQQATIGHSLVFFLPTFEGFQKSIGCHGLSLKSAHI